MAGKQAVGVFLLQLFPRSCCNVWLRSGQVFWLPDQPTFRAFPSKMDSGIKRNFVPGYSSATATDLHRSSLHPRAFVIDLLSNPSICSQRFGIRYP